MKQDLPHGNSSNKRPFSRTAPSQIMKQKTKLDIPPKRRYIEVQQEKHINPKTEAILLPKNLKQVQNTTYRERVKRLPSNDDILGLYSLHEETKFVASLKLIGVRRA